jgi:hypothetical protein
VAQGRAKPVDWLVQDLYGLGEDEGGQEFRNDEADDSEDEREELRRQVCTWGTWVSIFEAPLCTSVTAHQLQGG